jgi:hypothetical protein
MLALLEVWQKEVGLYSAVVAELSQNIDSIGKIEYEELSGAAEAARIRCVQAQADLDAHIAVHGCRQKAIAARAT